MSGPKRSSWSIAREIAQQQRRERAARRKSQIKEIETELRGFQKIVKKLIKSYGDLAQPVADRVAGWIDDARENCNYDLRDAWRGVNGISNYLDNQIPRLDEKARRREQKRLQTERNAKLKEQKEAQAFAAAQMRLATVREEIDKIEDELGEKSSEILSQPQQWLLEAQAQLESGNRNLLNSVKGIENYLQSKQSVITELKQQRFTEEKIERLVSSLTAVRQDYKEILNPGIEQRLELFSKSIRTNPDNPQTLKQIADFRARLAEEMEKFEEQRDNLKYVEEAFSSALGGTSSTGESGSSVISGTVAGVPITVSIDSKSNDIHFDTPDDGSCRAGISALISELEKSRINLGPIHIVKSGETINRKTSNFQPDRRHNA